MVKLQLNKNFTMSNRMQIRAYIVMSMYDDSFYYLFDDTYCVIISGTNALIWLREDFEENVKNFIEPVRKELEEIKEVLDYTSDIGIKWKDMRG